MFVFLSDLLFSVSVRLENTGQLSIITALLKLYCKRRDIINVLFYNYKIKSKNSMIFISSFTFSIAKKNYNE
jgi:hypothetical protein